MATHKHWHKSLLDHEQLRVEIQRMSPKSHLFKLLKEELTKLGRWKILPRGNPRKGYISYQQRAGKE